MSDTAQIIKQLRITFKRTSDAPHLITLDRLANLPRILTALSVLRNYYRRLLKALCLGRLIAEGRFTCFQRTKSPA